MKRTAQRVIFLFLPAIFLILQVNGQTKFQLAGNYIKEHAAAFGLKEADLADVRLIDENTDAATGISHIYLAQFYKGVIVYNAVAGVHLNSHNKVVYFTSSFQNGLDKKIKAAVPSLSASSSTIKAFQHLKLPVMKIPVAVSPPAAKASRANESWFAKTSGTLQDISSELMFFPSVTTREIKLVWKVDIYEAGAREWWDIFVDAQTGDIITKNNKVISCDFSPPAKSDSSLSVVSPGAAVSPYTANDFNVIQRPAEAPSFASRTIINSPWNLAAGAASPFGWLNDGTTNYTYTRGNNVWAYLDTLNTNMASGSKSADGGAGLNFNFPIDFNSEPASYTNAAVTQLFYANNIMHDIWYQYGFDEASRNFQRTNASGTGSANDAVRAEAQDSRNTLPCLRDNANMGTGADGISPRMQMYLWSDGANARINSPVSIAGNYPASSSTTFGPCIAVANVTGNVVITNPADGCATITNDTAVAGKIALIDRGNCSFTIKVKNAQLASATGVILVNNVAGTPGGLGGTDASITIPSVMVSDAGGAAIKTALISSPVNATLNTTLPEKDGDLDNGVIFHEYGHGITHRLTGNGSTCMGNAERGDEGWSDWYALVCTQKPGDNANTPRPVGTYVANQPTNGSGLRQYPYSYDMAIDPHTYTEVQSSGGEVHIIGEIWCSALWDMYWLLIDKYGYDPDIYRGTGGNNKAMKLVIDGLKFQVCSPGFLDARNAILTADTINNGAINSCLLWNAFARRGMGFSAIQGSSNSTADQTAAFDLPPACTPIVLPVDLVQFKASGIENAIKVNWKTGSEYNEAGFELLRKSVLQSPFVAVANVAAKGTGGAGADYNYTDKNVSPNVIYYYQLLEKDKDGKKNFSQVTTAMIEKHEFMAVYPNPVERLAYLQFGDGFKNMVTVKISDAFGRVVYNKIFRGVSNTRFVLDVSSYAAGVYEISVGDQNNIKQLRLIKK